MAVRLRFICCHARYKCIQHEWSLFLVSFMSTPLSSSSPSLLFSWLRHMNNCSETFDCSHLKLTVSDRSKQTSKQTYTRTCAMQLVWDSLRFTPINSIYCTMHFITYNPRLCGVGTRTTRSALTTSERSTAIGITTGMIGTTDDKRRNTTCVKYQHISKLFIVFWLNYQPFSTTSY